MKLNQVSLPQHRTERERVGQLLIKLVIAHIGMPLGQTQPAPAIKTAMSSIFILPKAVLKLMVKKLKHKVSASL